MMRTRANNKTLLAYKIKKSDQNSNLFQYAISIVPIYLLSQLLLCCCCITGSHNKKLTGYLIKLEYKYCEKYIMLYVLQI